jgi:GNAT superfamily N-acetyltransferase
VSRRLKPLLSSHLDALPCHCVGCVFWETAEPLAIECGSRCDLEALREWHAVVTEEWGDCGRVAVEDDEVIGFLKYAPVQYAPQAHNLPASPGSEVGVLLTCIHIRDDARRHGLGRLLLFAALKDAAQRGERYVWAYGYSQREDMGAVPMMGVEFLLRHGFVVDTPHPLYPLLKMDVRALVSWTENLEAMLQALRIPLRRPQPVPSPSIDA